MEFPQLETERLILRQVSISDAPAMLHYLSDEEVMKYYGMAPFADVAEVIEEIGWYKSIFAGGTGIRWGIARKEEPGRIIGSCGFFDRSDRHQRADIGYELSHEFWHGGIMTEAVSAILPHGFGEMGLMRIQGLVEPGNISSRKLLTKIGFQEEGLLRKYEMTGGKFDDLYMYSLLKEEWVPASYD